MSLSDSGRQRLRDVRELEPATNGALQNRWGFDSGSEVAEYLDDTLAPYVRRGDDRKVRVTDAAGDVLDDGADGADEAPEAEQVDAPGAPPAPSETPSHGEGETSATATDSGEETVDITPEAFDDAIQAAAAAARGDHTDQADTDDDGESVEESPDTGGVMCPKCGDAVAVVPGGKEWLAANGTEVTTEDGDRFCRKCHAVVGEDGEHISLADADAVDTGGGSVLGTIVKALGVVAVGAAVAVGLAGQDQQDDDQFMGKL